MKRGSSISKVIKFVLLALAVVFGPVTMISCGGGGDSAPSIEGLWRVTSYNEFTYPRSQTSDADLDGFAEEIIYDEYLELSNGSARDFFDFITVNDPGGTDISYAQGNTYYCTPETNSYSLSGTSLYMNGVLYGTIELSANSFTFTSTTGDVTVAQRVDASSVAGAIDDCPTFYLL